MNADDVFVQDLERFLERRAGTAHAGYLSETLESTSRAPQRRWWSSPERWLPVDLTMRRPLVPSIRPRAIALLVLLALLVASIAAYAIGTRHRLPPPFGLAQNGEVVVGTDGDLSVADPATGERRPLISGPAFDFGPVFSRDGTRFLFLRGGPTDCGQPDCGLLLMVADADGTALHPVTPGTPLLDGVDWSPDGMQIAFLGPVPKGNGHSINVVNVDGTGLHRLDVGRPAHLVSFRSGADPHRLPGRPADRAGPGARHLRRPPGRHGPSGPVATSRARSNDFLDLTVSWDGNLVAYQSTDDGLFQIHILVCGRGGQGPPGAPDDGPDQTGLLARCEVRRLHRSRRDSASSSWWPRSMVPGRAADSAPS